MTKPMAVTLWNRSLWSSKQQLIEIWRRKKLLLFEGTICLPCWAVATWCFTWTLVIPWLKELPTVPESKKTTNCSFKEKLVVEGTLFFLSKNNLFYKITNVVHYDSWLSSQGGGILHQKGWRLKFIALKWVTQLVSDPLGPFSSGNWHDMQNYLTQQIITDSESN